MEKSCNTSLCKQNFLSQTLHVGRPFFSLKKKLYFMLCHEFFWFELSPMKFRDENSNKRVVRFQIRSGKKALFSILENFNVRVQFHVLCTCSLLQFFWVQSMKIISPQFSHSSPLTQKYFFAFMSTRYTRDTFCNKFSNMILIETPKLKFWAKTCGNSV